MPNPTALITGASSGIGLELARLFAADGYDLALAARSAQKLNELSAELKQAHGIRTCVLPIDLAQPQAAQQVFQSITDQGLAIEALVNNAGFGVRANLGSASLDDSLGMIQLNVTTLTALTHLFLPGMLKRGKGRILNVGSTGSFSPVPSMAVYAATKAYVLSFSEALAEELRGAGITVTALCPGVTITGFQARSGVGSSLMMRLGSMTAVEVAKAGYRAMQSGRAVVVPGLFNRLMAGTIPFTPRRLVLLLSRQLVQD